MSRWGRLGRPWSEAAGAGDSSMADIADVVL
jgi:hypothetical protein